MPEDLNKNNKIFDNTDFNAFPKYHKNSSHTLRENI